ncbi:tyrosine-protein phosphatase [Micromonospora sp. HUAS LYJ1]|uniref:tyrosine-protein phosphatase n=1 Tax=Micromonospora sp. HUAS LYJ1 TaxID=3061626 RepID=UPI002670DC7C|nr:tyrosine-protein phosphatase [Micromonospora sp. HUAS LYJ1]WKU07443.1 tyrosine-protein phosphatase [Micromonospora sp. HUAS LYJ1]
MTVGSWTLAGAPNARDLGGLPTRDGRRVRPGRLIRTPALGRLTEADLTVLGRLAPACVVDLRDATETALAPPNRLVGDPYLVRLPVLDPAHSGFGYLSAVLLGHDLTGHDEAARRGAAAAMAELYRWFVSGAAAREGFARAVRLAADPVNLPLLFHCSAGKDRTGWLAVVLLTALGVDEETVRADYLRHNALTVELRGEASAAMLRRRPELDPETARAVLEVRPEYLDAGFDEVRRRHGSFDAYLADGLGVTPQIRAALRTHLLD